MVRVQVGPPKPGCFGHRSEDRMRRPVVIAGRCRDDFNQGLERCEVRGEIPRSGAAHFLIHFRPRRNAGRPWQWNVQRNPLHDCRLEGAARTTRGFLLRHHAARVGEVAHHLVSRHPSPSARAFRPHRLQPAHDLCLVARPCHRLHGRFHPESGCRPRAAPRATAPKKAGH
jgi:hypothetical protein